MQKIKTPLEKLPEKKKGDAATAFSKNNNQQLKSDLRKKSDNRFTIGEMWSHPPSIVLDSTVVQFCKNLSDLPKLARSG